MTTRKITQTTLAAVLLLATTGAALAQAPAPTPVPAPSPAAAPTPASSPAKKELVTKILQLQQPGVEQLARAIAEQPAAQVMQQAGQALQRVPQERREALARDVEADLRKYVDEAVPIVRDRAVKAAPTTMGPMIEERFTEDELRELVRILESPVNRKWQGMGGDFQRVLTEKLVADSRGEIEPKVRAMAENVSRRLNPPAPAGSAPAPAPKGSKGSSGSSGK